MNIEVFDKIYCLHCIEHKERMMSSLYEFNKVNLINKVEYRMTSLQPKENLLMSESLHKLRNESEYHCTREHYTMIKIAYLSNYDYILIFEDDIKLIKKSLFDKFMNNIPNDFDILRLGGATHHVFEQCHELYQNGILWDKMKFPLWCTMGYALSRRGMKYYIDYVENEYCVADLPLYDIKAIQDNQLNNYISTLPIIYFYNYNTSIQENYNDIEFKNMYYANIDKHLYE